MPRLPAGGFLDPVEAGGDSVRVDLQVVDRAVRRNDQVGAAHGERVEPDLRGHDVEQRFERMPRIHRAVPAHRAARGRVGVHAISAIPDGRHQIQRMEQRAGVENRDQAVAAVRAATLDDLAVDGGDLARFFHAELQADVGLGPPAVGEKPVLARKLGLYGTAGGACEGAGHHLEVERLDPMAESAADERLHHANARAVHAEALGKREMQVVRHLRHRMRGQAILLRLVFGDRGIELDLPVRDLGVVKRLLADKVRGGESRVDIAEHLIDFAFDVAGLLVVQSHGVRVARVGSVEVRGERLDVEHDRGESRLRGRLVDRGDGGHGLAAIADLVARERPLVLRDRDHAIGRREVLAGDDGAHTGKRQRLGGIDATNDTVRDGTAQNPADERSAERKVGGVARASCDLLDAIDQRRPPPGRALLRDGGGCDGMAAAGRVDDVVHRIILLRRPRPTR